MKQMWQLVRMCKLTLPTYKTTNWAANAFRQEGQVADVQRRHHPDLPDHESAIQNGASPDRAMGAPLVRVTMQGGFVESLLWPTGLDWVVPDFRTICQHQKALAVNIPYRHAKGPLHLLIDSTRIRVEEEGEWNARKHGCPKRCVWRKIHIGNDEQRWKSEQSRLWAATPGMH